MLNPLPLMQWNIEKHYLKDLQDKGVPIVSTRWSNAFNNSVIDEAFSHFNCDTVVVKPTLSANADDTFKLSASNWYEQQQALSDTFNQRDFMIQPFLNSVVEEGEYSLFYFGGGTAMPLKGAAERRFSRTRRTRGSLHPVTVDEEQSDIAQKALSAMPCEALYARVDLVRTVAGR